MIVNRDDGTDTADLYAEASGLPILARIPLNHRVRVLADACKLSFEVPEFDEIFSDLTGRLTRREIPPCTDYKPLEYQEFLDVFGAAEPPGHPTSAKKSDLFDNVDEVKTFLPDIDLMPSRQVQAASDDEQRVQDIMEKIGIHVTGLDSDKDDGITVTSGATEIRIGRPDELDAKAEFLTALLGTKQNFSLIDVRYVDAPSYR
jgi:chlorophyllide a reductase subunit X